MDAGRKHMIIQTVAISLLSFLRKRYKAQNDELEVVHMCHADEGRKDGSEELLYRTQGYKEWVRIRIDIVNEEYGDVVKAESEKYMKSMDEKFLSFRDVIAAALLERVTGIKLR